MAEAVNPKFSQCTTNDDRRMNLERTFFYDVFQFMNTIPVNIYQHTRETCGSSRTHWHNDLEIGLLVSGNLRCYIGGRVKDIKDGQVFLVNSGELHCTVPQYNGIDCYAPGLTLVINHDFIKSIVPEYDQTYFELSGAREEQQIAVLMFEILDLYQEKTSAKELLLLGRVCEILYVLFSKCTKKRDAAGDRHRKDLEQQKAILNYIHANYTQPLRQGDIAERFGYSKEYFCRLFKKTTGRTFKNYLTACRLANAENMLRQVETTVLNIAQSTGFPDEQTFISAFKKQYGETPGKYRERSKPTG